MDISSVGSVYQSGLPNTVQNTTNTTDLQQTNTSSAHNTKKHHHKHGGNFQPPTVDSMLSQLTSKLGLNDNQMADLKNILNKAFASMNSANQTVSTDQSGQPQNQSNNLNNSKNRTILDNMNNQIRSLLNPSQLSTFNNMLQARQNDNDGDAT